LAGLVSNKAKPGIYVAWKTVTYRSVMLMALGVALIFGAIMHVAFPQFTDSSLKAAGSFTSRMLEQVAGLAPPIQRTSAAVSKQATETTYGTPKRTKV